MPSMVSRLKQHREAAGLSQARYNPSLKLAMDLAERLGVTVYDLFSFRESC